MQSRIADMLRLKKTFRKLVDANTCSCYNLRSEKLPC